MTSENAQIDKLKVLTPNSVKETLTIENGYMAGVDFPEGTYDIELTLIGEYGGKIKKESYEKTEFKRILNNETTIYRNVEFPKGTMVTVEEVSAVFTTSEFDITDIV